MTVLGLPCCAGFFLVVVEWGLLSSCGSQASHCSDLLQSTGSGVRRLQQLPTWALEHGPESCGAGAQLLRGEWDLPGPGIEPVSPALAGGFFTIKPPGKPQVMNLVVVEVSVETRATTSVFNTILS